MAPDKFSKEKRSYIMSKIRSKETKIEVKVFKELKKRKIYFQKHYGKVFGSPDIALPRKKKAVFIDGDFWHGYELEQLKERLPKDYWIGKIEKNVTRDTRISEQLNNNGWKVLRIWEHELIDNFLETIDRIINFLSSEKQNL